MEIRPTTDDSNQQQQARDNPEQPTAQNGHLYLPGDKPNTPLLSSRSSSQVDLIDEVRAPETVSESASKSEVPSDFVSQAPEKENVDNSDAKVDPLNALGQRERDGELNASEHPEYNGKIDASEEPESNEKINSAEQSGTDDKKQTSDKPGADDKKHTSEQPGTDDKNHTSEQPGTDDKKQTSEQPGTDDKKQTSEQPGTDDKKQTSEQPGTDDKKNSSEHPERDGKTNVLEQPDKDGKTVSTSDRETAAREDTDGDEKNTNIKDIEMVGEGDKTQKDAHSNSNMKSGVPLLTKPNSQKTPQSATHRKKESSASPRKPIPRKKKYSYIPIVGIDKDKQNSGESKRKKGDNNSSSKDKDKGSLRSSKSSLSSSSQNIAMKDKSDPVPPSNGKVEPVFSAVGGHEHIVMKDQSGLDANEDTVQREESITMKDMNNLSPSSADRVQTPLSMIDGNENIALEDKSDPIPTQAAKVETTFSVINEIDETAKKDKIIPTLASDATGDVPSVVVVENEKTASEPSPPSGLKGEATVSIVVETDDNSLKDKNDSIYVSDTKRESPVSIIRDTDKNEKNEINAKIVKWKVNDLIKDKKHTNGKKESKIPELDKKKQHLIQKSLQREKAVLSNGSVKSTEVVIVQKGDHEVPVEKETKVNIAVTAAAATTTTTTETKTDASKPKSILARAIMKKVKKGSGQTQTTVDSKLNGGPPPPAVKPTGKIALTVPSPVPYDTAEDKDDKLSIGSRRDSTKFSLSDSMSRKSVDYRVANATTVVIPTNDADEKSKPVVPNNDSWIRSAIPFMPMSMAVLCFLLNIVLPGTGTILSGVSIMCCGKVRVQTKDDHVPLTLCVNVMVGVAQMFTVTFLLVGWFWSMAWGIKMIILSLEYRKELKQKREKELQALALSAFGSPAHGRSLFG